MASSADQSTTLPASKSSTATLAFKDSFGNPTTPPAGVPAWRPMDQYFNADRNDNIITLVPAADGQSALFQGLTPGVQNVQVDVSGLPSVHIAVTVAAGPASNFQVSFTTPA